MGRRLSNLNEIIQMSVKTCKKLLNNYWIALTPIKTFPFVKNDFNNF